MLSRQLNTQAWWTRFSISSHQLSSTSNSLKDIKKQLKVKEKCILEYLFMITETARSSYFVPWS
eukprot:m.41013 g.41013  ORF g.41013 m.41013 type:complete len:64 (+) comp6971_c0_seq1:424-615(+)